MNQQTQNMKKNILWDFDGVLLDSNAIRGQGFQLIFQKYPQDKIDQLLEFHRKNGGISRYVKFRYFYEEILRQPLSEERFLRYAEDFSAMMLAKLQDPALLIRDSMDFVAANHKDYNFHIVSGSDQTELRHLCRQLEIDHYFLTILGSPTPKGQLVSDLLKERGYQRQQTILIGDSINDHDAAVENTIDFYGYNNPELRDISTVYIDTFTTITTI